MKVKTGRTECAGGATRLVAIRCVTDGQTGRTGIDIYTGCSGIRRRIEEGAISRERRDNYSLRRVSVRERLFALGTRTSRFQAGGRRDRRGRTAFDTRVCASAHVHVVHTYVLHVK